MDGKVFLIRLSLLSLVFLLPLASADWTYLQVRFWYPDANLNLGNTALYIRGDSLGLNWGKGIIMNHDVANCWTMDLPYLANMINKTIQIKPLLNDGQWSIGANFAITLLNEDSVVDLYPYFYSSTGKYQYVRNVKSPQLWNNVRDLVIYTPPSYYENTLKTYSNVLVMHDGQNLFNDSTSFTGVSWHCQQTLDYQIVAAGIDEVVVIGVDNTANRTNEYTYSFDPTVPGGGNGSLYLDFLQNTVVPLVKSTFRISPSTSSLGILGSSLGGLISCYAGYTRSDVWGRAGCMSSSFWWNNQDFAHTVLKQNPVPKSLVVYLDSGDAGPDYDDEAETLTVTDDLQSLGFTMNGNLFYYLDEGGAHNETYWGNRFWRPLTDLYPPAIVTPSPQQSTTFSKIQKL